LKTARKGLGRYTVTIHGRAAHAGLDPTAGASAILELSSVIQRLFALNDYARGITINVGTIEGGIRSNVVAPESEASVDVRVLRHEDATAIDAAIRSLDAQTPGTEIAVEGGFGRPPMERSAANAALFTSAIRIGSELGLELQEVTAGGGSDGNTTSQHTATLDGLGAIGDGAHAPSEHVLTGSLPTRTALLAGLLLEPIDQGGHR
jgi:glutamate carboxypeptidase